MHQVSLRVIFCRFPVPWWRCVPQPRRLQAWHTRRHGIRAGPSVADAAGASRMHNLVRLLSVQDVRGLLPFSATRTQWLS